MNITEFIHTLNKEERKLLRFVLTGKDIGLPLDKTMEILGREKCIKRIDDCIQFLKKGE